MKITQALLDSLTEQAKASPRLRMNYDLRNDDNDQSQRMLNAIEPGTIVPVHRHQKSSETIVILRGHAIETFFDDFGHTVDETYDLCPNGDCVAVNVPIGQWHTIRPLVSGTVIMEIKDGPYEPQNPIDVLF